MPDQHTFDNWPEIEAQQASVDAEQHRVGITYDDLLPLLLDDAHAIDPGLARLEQIAHNVGATRVFIGPISLDDQLAVLRTLPTGAGGDASLAAFRAYRIAKSQPRDRDV